MEVFTSFAFFQNACLQLFFCGIDMEQICIWYSIVLFHRPVTSCMFLQPLPSFVSFNFWPLISLVPFVIALACIPAKCTLIYPALLYTLFFLLWIKVLTGMNEKFAGLLTTPNTPTVFSCSVTDVSLIIPHGTGGTIVSWSNPDTPPMIMLLIQTRRPGDYFPVGSTEVIYTYLNEMTGERIRCAFNVIVKEDVSEG